MTTNLLCPECLSGNQLGTIEKITGVAALSLTRNDDGTVNEHHSGSTDVDWDSSKTVGIECSCGYRHLGSDWASTLTAQPKLEQLVAAALALAADTDIQPDPHDFIDAAGKVSPETASSSAVRLLSNIVGAEIGNLTKISLIEGVTLDDIFELVHEHRATVEEGVLLDTHA